MCGTILKKTRKKLLPAILDKAEKQQPMTILEKDFLGESAMMIDSFGIRNEYGKLTNAGALLADDSPIRGGVALTNKKR